MILTALLACTAGPDPVVPVDEPVPEVQTVTRYPGPDETLGAMFCVDGAIEPWEKFARVADPERLSADQTERFADLLALKTPCTRVKSRYGLDGAQAMDADRAELDTLFAAMDAHGVDVLAVIGPASTTEAYGPADQVAWREWVRGLVERYDGDGIDDAPGLTRGVHHWQVADQPDLEMSDAERRGVNGYAVAKDYAKLLELASGAIREADPEADIVTAGAFASDSDRFADYMPEVFRTVGPDVFDAVGVRGTAQVGTKHLWDCADPLAAAAPGKQVWVTSTSTASQSPGTARTQASDLLRTWLESTRRGVRRVYWDSLWETPGQHLPDDAPDSFKAKAERGFPGSTMTGHHLYRGDGERRRFKLSAYVLVELQTRYGSHFRSEVIEVPVGDQAHAIRIGGETLVWSVEDRPSGPVTVTIESPDAIVTPLLPAEDGEHEIIEAPTYPSTRVAAVDGKITVDVGPGPVRIEAAE